MHDRDILRPLAAAIAEAAAGQSATWSAWRDLNALRPGRPLLHIFQIPWEEFPAAWQGSCADPWLRAVEVDMRRLLWQWRHCPGDLLLPRAWYVEPVLEDSGFGMQGGVQHAGRPGGAQAFTAGIRSLADVERIQLPTVHADAAAQQRQVEMLDACFGDLLPVHPRGIVHRWCAPWDVLVRWYGIEQLYLDMVDEPELVHAAIGRMMDALLHRRDQWQEQGLLSTGDGGYQVGSGGYGVSDELPGGDGSSTPCTPMQQWGTSTGQIFGDVSPGMHEEFCLAHELRWLEGFGLNCYGCCEPLHEKMEMLRRIPRLRRISCSPWIDDARAAEAIGTAYVYSLKPNPALVCAPRFDLEAARQDLRRRLQRCAGSRVEIILKDLHTLHGEPQRLQAWERMAMQEAAAV